MSKLQDILKYAELGWYVFPLFGKSKNPACKWENESTTSRNQIIRWFRKYPQNNVGLDCGKSRIVVIDFDDYKGDIDFELSEADLDTVQAITGRGGKHYYYRALADCNITNSASQLADNLDIRGNGGLTVLPPSIHPDTGNRYKWVEGHSPFEKKLRPVPQRIVDEITRSEAEKQASKGDKKQLDTNASSVDKQLVLLALNSFDGDVISYDEWLNVYVAVSGVFSKEKTLRVMGNWARFTARDERKYDTFRTTKISIGTVFYYAKQYGGFDVGTERKKLKNQQHIGLMKSLRSQRKGDENKVNENEEKIL